MSPPPPPPPAGHPRDASFHAKRQYRDAILFFRMGDFYEMFYEDADAAARARAHADVAIQGHERRGDPDVRGSAHAADTYVARLVRKGFRVAICEQMEDPKKAKGVVRARSCGSCRRAR